MKIRPELAIAALVVAMAPSITVVHGGEAENLLSNGGFEERMAGWTPDPEHELVTEEGAAHSGKACLTGEVHTERKGLGASFNNDLRIRDPPPGEFSPKGCTNIIILFPIPIPHRPMRDRDRFYTRIIPPMRPNPK